MRTRFDETKRSRSFVKRKSRERGRRKERTVFPSRTRCLPENPRSQASANPNERLKTKNAKRKGTERLTSPGPSSRDRTDSRDKGSYKRRFLGGSLHPPKIPNPKSQLVVTTRALKKGSRADEPNDTSSTFLAISLFTVRMN